MLDPRIDISKNIDIIEGMELIEIFKALSNRTRLEILRGLKDPVKNFPPQDEGDVHEVGVCVSSIQEGVGLSQSTVSGYLATLQRAGLIEVRRIGQWTYYKRNEETISALAELIRKEL
ncbi:MULTISPECIES: ArsR/SmtB family transcription factor [Halomonadaceae]|nr:MULTISPECIES: metalloregulator ArsR/SmtB family transcription factor [unclassified Halomonas]